MIALVIIYAQSFDLFKKRNKLYRVITVHMQKQKKN